MAAHRPSTLSTADTVVLLEDGRIIGIGPHQDLPARCPAYGALLNRKAQVTEADLELPRERAV